MKIRILFVALLMAVGQLYGIGQEAKPNFSGTWKLSGECSTPKRGGNATLHIEQHGPELTVETTVVKGSSTSRHAVQHFRTDGKVSVTTGADGDEFHTAIVWRDRTMVFSIEEHEDGRVLASKEEWTLIEGGAALQRVRHPAHESTAPKEKQTLIYLKDVPLKDVP